MILTTISDLAKYQGVHPAFPATFAALEQLSKEDFVTGRHEVDGDRIFINCAQYETKAPADSCMEYHGRYIDVMWMCAGEEVIGIYPSQELASITRPYDENADVALAELEKEYTALRMVPGSVAILFPEDAHAPSMQLKGPCKVQKMIAKVRID